jgi:transposase
LPHTESQQVSLTDPDARPINSAGKGAGIVGYNVQTAVDTKNHIIVAHEVTNAGNDCSQPTDMSNLARQALTSNSKADWRFGTSEY